MDTEKELLVSRIPRRKSEDHLQLILGKRLPGSLFCLSQTRANSKAKFATGSITIPISTIQQHPELIEALNSTNGVEMTIPPIGKLYFRPKQVKSASDASSLQTEISKIKSEISNLSGVVSNLQHAMLAMSADITNIKSILYSTNASSGCAPIFSATQPVTSVPTQQRYVFNQDMRDHSRSYSAHTSPHAKQKQTIPPTASSPQTSPS